jgi:hypothetical protein
VPPAEIEPNHRDGSLDITDQESLLRLFFLTWRAGDGIGVYLMHVIVARSSCVTLGKAQACGV